MSFLEFSVGSTVIDLSLPASRSMGKKVLSVATSNDTLGDTKTGLWYVTFFRARFARITVLKKPSGGSNVFFRTVHIV